MLLPASVSDTLSKMTQEPPPIRPQVFNFLPLIDVDNCLI